MEKHRIEPRRAAVLVPRSGLTSAPGRDMHAARVLACRLYAAAHDMIVVGEYDPRPDPIPWLNGEQELRPIGPDGFDLVLAVPPDADDLPRDAFDAALKQLRADQHHVIMIGRR